MRSYTTTQARKYLTEIMDIVMAGEPVIITRGAALLLRLSVAKSLMSGRK